MTRQYLSLPAHSSIYFHFNTWLIDLLSYADLFQIYFDGQLIQDINTYSADSSTYPTWANYCGGSKVDFPSVPIDGQAIHSSSSLRIEIVSMYTTAATDTFSFGIRSLSLLFQLNPVPSNLVCQITPTTSSSVSCTCPIGQYSPNGSSGCQLCDNSCQSCIGPYNTNCTSCKPGYSFNGQTCIQCDLSCDQCSSTTVTGCIRCDIGKFLYWNNTCQGNCASPLIPSTLNNYSSCRLPCSTSEYHYQNGTCQSACPASFNIAYQGDLRLCNFPCGNTEYLYSNGTCSSSCSVPMLNITTGLEKYCNLPCSNQEFLYSNSSCLQVCDIPFIQGLNASVQTCSFPCQSSLYLDSNGSCISACPNSSLVIQDGLLRVCQLLPQIVSIEQPDSFIFSPTIKTITQTAVFAGSILRPNSPNSAFMTALAKIVKYVKNLDVPILDSVRHELNSQASGPFSLSLTFTVPMPSELEAQFTKKSLPAIFNSSGYHSSFIVNHWESMSTYLILFVLGWLATKMETIVEKHWRKKFIVIAIVKRIRVIARWNFVLFVLFNTYDDLTFFPILEISTLKLDSPAAIVSFSVCIIMTVIAFFILAKTAWICRDVSRINNNTIDKTPHENKKLIYKKWGNYQVLFAGFKDVSLITQSYLFISTVRIVICYLFVGLLYQHPLVQTVQLTIMSVMMVIYILWKRPINDLVSLIIIISYEIMALIVNICVLILAVSDSLHTLNKQMQTHLSHVILVVNTIINTFGGVVTWIYIVTGMWSAYKASKKYGLGGKTSWIAVPLASYQNPGMDFDDYSCVYVDPSTTSTLDQSEKPAEDVADKAEQQEDDIPNVYNPKKRIRIKKGFIFDSSLAMDSANERIKLNTLSPKDSIIFTERQFRDDENLSNGVKKTKIFSERSTFSTINHVEGAQSFHESSGFMSGLKRYVIQKIQRTKAGTRIQPEPLKSHTTTKINLHPISSLQESDYSISARNSNRDNLDSTNLKHIHASSNVWNHDDLDTNRMGSRVRLFNRLRTKVAPTLSHIS